MLDSLRSSDEQKTIAAVIPLFGSLEPASLAKRCSQLSTSSQNVWHFVFVFDGPDSVNVDRLAMAMKEVCISFDIYELHKNCGVSTAIREGLAACEADVFTFFGSDGQDPIELVIQLCDLVLAGDSEVAMGVRETRDDPWVHRIGAALFWRLQKKYVFQEVPSGGCDVVSLNRGVRDLLLEWQDSDPNIVSQIFALGFPIQYTNYERSRREVGKSSWTLKRKLLYFIDNFFNYGRLPVGISAFLFLLFSTAALTSSITVILTQNYLTAKGMVIIVGATLLVGVVINLLFALILIVYAQKIYAVSRDIPRVAARRLNEQKNPSPSGPSSHISGK